MLGNLLFAYSDKEVTTIGDLMNNWWGYFVPILNVLVTIAIPIYYITEYCSNKNILEKNKKNKN